MPELDLFAPDPTCGTCGNCEPSFVGGSFCALSYQTVKETDPACRLYAYKEATR